MKRVVISTGSLVLISLVVIVAHLLVLGVAADMEQGGSPFTAVPLRDGKNASTLGPGQARWYKFAREGDDGALQRHMDLTLIFTPDDGRRIHRVNFQIFPAEQIARWYWRDVSQMQSIGVGGIVSRDGNPTTGELLWSGWVVDNDAYYVQVFNGADLNIDYWLFTDNVIAAELGGSANLPPAVEVPAGAESSRSPAPGLQTGQLSAGQDTWYAVIFDDYDDEANELHTFTLIFTPADGDRVPHVSFEVFPADQLHTWQPDSTEHLRSVGAGSVVSRDGDPNTGELMWSGWLVDGETYYIHLRNDAKLAIDYWFFMAAGRPETGDLGAP